MLHAVDGSQVPAQLSIRPMAKNGFGEKTIGMVVTDLTEARRNEEILRALSRSLVHAQEAERGRVSLELHDNITQLLCAIVVRSQALAVRISTSDGPS
jgi:signal transduction histidine kinase